VHRKEGRIERDKGKGWKIMTDTGLSKGMRMKEGDGWQALEHHVLNQLFQVFKILMSAVIMRMITDWPVFAMVITWYKSHHVYFTLLFTESGIHSSVCNSSFDRNNGIQRRHHLLANTRPKHQTLSRQDRQQRMLFSKQ